MKYFAIDFSLNGLPSFSLVIAKDKSEAKHLFFLGISEPDKVKILEVSEISNEEYKRLIAYGITMNSIGTKL